MRNGTIAEKMFENNTCVYIDVCGFVCMCVKSFNIVEMAHRLAEAHYRSKVFFCFQFYPVYCIIIILGGISYVNGQGIIILDN